MPRISSEVNTLLSVMFSTFFSLSGNVMKFSLLCGVFSCHTNAREILSHFQMPRISSEFNTLLWVMFSTFFSVSGNVMKFSLLCDVFFLPYKHGRNTITFSNASNFIRVESLLRFKSLLSDSYSTFCKLFKRVWFNWPHCEIY